MEKCGQTNRPTNSDRQTEDMIQAAGQYLSWLDSESPYWIQWTGFRRISRRNEFLLECHSSEEDKFTCISQKKNSRWYIVAHKDGTKKAPTAEIFAVYTTLVAPSRPRKTHSRPTDGRTDGQTLLQSRFVATKNTNWGSPSTYMNAVLHYTTRYSFHSPLRFQPQNVTLLHFINIHANFQLPIFITVDFISDGCHRPVLDP